jgi:hypothetical protein
MLKLSLYGPGPPRRAPGGWVSQISKNRHIKVVRLSELRTGRLYFGRDTPYYHFCQRLIWPHGHSAVGRIKSMKNPNDSIENRTHNPPTCSTVPGKRCIVCDTQSKVMLNLTQRNAMQGAWGNGNQAPFILSLGPRWVFEMSSSYMAALFSWRDANEDSSVV